LKKYENMKTKKTILPSGATDFEGNQGLSGVFPPEIRPTNLKIASYRIAKIGFFMPKIAPYRAFKGPL
jgi:hypothetical protein